MVGNTVGKLKLREAKRGYGNFRNPLIYLVAGVTRLKLATFPSVMTDGTLYQPLYIFAALPCLYLVLTSDGF